MPKREAIVHTNLGITTYATDKSPEELIKTLQDKHKHQTIISIQIKDRITTTRSFR